MEEDQYADLDARIHANTQCHEALRIVLFQSLQLLHRDGHIRLQELADRAEGFDAFHRAQDKPAAVLLAPLVAALRDLGAKLDE